MVTLDQAGAGASALALVAPPAAVSCVAELAWFEAQAKPASDAAERAWRIVPDASAHLIFSQTRRDSATGTTVRSRLALVGARSRYEDIDRSGRVSTAGVRLLPGAVFMLFGFPADELTDRSIRLDEIAPAAARNLLERLPAAPAAERPALLFEFLHARLRIDDGASVAQRTVQERIARLSRARDRQSDVDLASLARELGLGPRGLRLFTRRHAGLSPGRCLRIARLHRAVGLGLQSRMTGWGRVAAVAGYADQSHMIRDFQDLLGESPGRFARRRISSDRKPAGT